MLLGSVTRIKSTHLQMLKFYITYYHKPSSWVNIQWCTRRICFWQILNRIRLLRSWFEFLRISPHSYTKRVSSWILWVYSHLYNAPLKFNPWKLLPKHANLLISYFVVKLAVSEFHSIGVAWLDPWQAWKGRNSTWQTMV